MTAETHTVEAVGWDISLGLATTGVGQLFLRATSQMHDCVPESIDHVGIKVYGCVYEYGDLGILKTLVPAGHKLVSRYPTFKLRAVENVGETRVPREEFEAWVNEHNSSKFAGFRYDVVNHNCIHWAVLATQFLGASYPSNWDNICKYAKANKTIASVVGQSITTSRQLNFKPLGTFE